jgi:hypothetical protein
MFGEVVTHNDIITPCSSSVIKSNHHKYDGFRTSSPYQNVFYRQKVAERVYTHLLAHTESSKRAIARATYQPYSSVRKAVDWLIVHKLITFNQAEGLYLGEQKSIEEFEQISAIRGTTDKSERRKRYYQYERERNINRQLAKRMAYWRHKTGT